MPRSTAQRPIASTSSTGYTAPVGLLGDTNSSALVRSVTAASSWSTVTRKPVVSSVGSTTGTPPDERDRLGVGGPVRRREEHLVAGVEERGEGVVDGVLAAVGDEHLAGLHVEAGVAQRLDGDGLLQLGQAAGRRVLVVLRVAGTPRRPPPRCGRASGSRARRRRSRSPARRPPSAPWPWRRRRAWRTRRWRRRAG